MFQGFFVEKAKGIIFEDTDCIMQMLSIIEDVGAHQGLQFQFFFGMGQSMVTEHPLLTHSIKKRIRTQNPDPTIRI